MKSGQDSNYEYIEAALIEVEQFIASKRLTKTWSHRNIRCAMLTCLAEGHIYSVHIEPSNNGFVFTVGESYAGSAVDEQYFATLEAGFAWAVVTAINYEINLQNDEDMASWLEAINSTHVG